jgi:hypothetical protein
MVLLGRGEGGLHLLNLQGRRGGQGILLDALGRMVRRLAAERGPAAGGRAAWLAAERGPAAGGRAAWLAAERAPEAGGRARPCGWRPSAAQHASSWLPRARVCCGQARARVGCGQARARGGGRIRAPVGRAHIWR